MRLCVIGDPVGHSLSPRIHRRFMERCGTAGSYEAVTVTAETLEDFVQALPAKAVVYDLVYHPTDTALLRAAEHRGLTAVGGLALLVQQAALSFAHFTGIVPDAALCRDILQELEAAQ